MKNLRKSHAITLIALVITIIVLLILAGVSLNLMTGSDGILGKAKSAREKTVKAQETELIELAYMEVLTEHRIDGTEITLEALQEKLNQSKSATVEEIEEVPEGGTLIDSGRENGSACKITMENTYYMYYKEADTRIKFYIDLYEGQEFERTLTLFAPEEMDFKSWIFSEYNQDLNDPWYMQNNPGGWWEYVYSFSISGSWYSLSYYYETDEGLTRRGAYLCGEKILCD